MRLGKKKEKDKDGEKEQCIDGIARLICSAKQSHPAPLRGKLNLHERIKRINLISCLKYHNFSHSLHRWHRVERCQVLPTLLTVADTCEKLSSRLGRSGNIINIQTNFYQQHQLSLYDRKKN